MRKGTEKKRGAIICAAVIVGLLAIVLAIDCAKANQNNN